MRNLNFIPGCKLLTFIIFRIGRALSRTAKKGTSPKAASSQSYDTASVHVTFISNQVNMIINEESLRVLFSQFGEVVDVVINKSSIDQVIKSYLFKFYLCSNISKFRTPCVKVDTDSFIFLEQKKE